MPWRRSDASAVAVELIDVVLVEDDDDDAQFVLERLPSDEFAVRRVRTLADALEHVHADGRSLCVLLDLAVHDAGGLDGIERLRREAPEVPVVVLTGDDDATAGLTALASGAQDHLVKGRISSDMLPRAIRYSLERKSDEGVLAEVRERFRLAFEDGPLGIALIGCDDDEHRILEVNRALGDMLGQAGEQLVGRRFEELTHWQDREAQAHAMGELLDGTTDRYGGERRLIHAAGHIVWCTITGSAVRDAGGRLIYGIALVDDVTDRKLQEEALREAHQALDTAVLGIALVGISGRVRTVNAYYAARFGYAPHELVGVAWTECVHPDDRDAVVGAIAEVLRGDQATIEVRGLRKDGSSFDKEVVLVPNLTADGALNGYFHFMRDVTDRRTAQRALEESEARYRRIIETSNDGVWLVDTTGRTTFVNERMAALLGRQPEELIGRSFLDFLHGEERARASRSFAQREEGESVSADYRFVRKDGELVWLLVSTTKLVENGEGVGALAMMSDITDRKRAETEMRRLALSDELTGLPNRALLEDRLRHAVSAADRGSTSLAVLFVDLDRFKMVNDGFGHEVGDELLREVAPRLATAIREGDTLARFGGDEFVILCGDLHHEHEAIKVADRVLAVLEEPFDLSVGPVTIDASVGVVARARAAATADDMLRDADIAMYRAKEAGGGRREVFDLTMHKRVVDDVELERALRRALAGEGLAVVYQPIVSLPDERVVGFEALLRWNHPERGSVPPAEFIPLAERTGLIGDVGRYVLGEACRQVARWTASESPPDWARVAVNVSARQVDDPALLDDVRTALAGSGIEPSRLELEITETALFSQDSGVTAATLDALHALGVGVVLDDFGTGYSSLSYVSRFALTGLKLDRAFISDAGGAGGNRSIVAAVTAMAQSLGLTLVGEGVETVEQASMLASLGCDLAQGFLFARPMAADDVEQWVASRTKHLAGGDTLFSDPAGAWMPMGDAADALGVSASTMRRWADEGRVRAHRTSGGHRRFSVADLKRLRQATEPRLNLHVSGATPLPGLAEVIGEHGAQLIAAVVGVLYEKPTRGWFASDRARRPLCQWTVALTGGLRTGDHAELGAATTRLVRQAEVAGASLLECSLFVERFTGAVLKTLHRLTGTAHPDDAAVWRALTVIRHGVVAEH